MFHDNASPCNESQYGATTLWHMGISLIPYPQDVVLAGEDFPIQHKFVIALDQDASEQTLFTVDDYLLRLREKGVNAEIKCTLFPETLASS